MGSIGWIIGGVGLIVFLSGSYGAINNQSELNQLEKMKDYGNKERMIHDTESALAKCVVMLFIGILLMISPLLVRLFDFD